MRIRMLAPDQQVNDKAVKVGEVVDDANASHARWLIRNGLAKEVVKEQAKPKAEKKQEAAK